MQLFFRFPPLEDSPEPPLEKSGDPNDLLERRTLWLSNNTANIPVIEFEKWITTSVGRLPKFFAAKDEELRTAASDLQLNLEFHAQALRNQVRGEWYRQRELVIAQSSMAMLRKPVRASEFDCCTFPFESQSHPQLSASSAQFSRRDTILKASNPLVLSAYLLVAFLRAICGLSISECSVVLPWLELVINLSGSSTLSDRQKEDREPTCLHSDVRSVLKVVGLEAESTRYVCCPSCFKLYPADSPSTDLHPPDVCNYKRTPASPVCSARLSRTRFLRGREIKVFVKEFYYYSLKDWLADMLHRPGMEDTLSECQVNGSYDPEGTMDDIFDGSALRDLNDNAGRPFLRAYGSELRLVFGLSVDAYNPLHNKQAGKKVSSTAISLVCYNLPKGQRLLVHNVHVLAIIPGPHEPSLSEINHLLVPIVEEFQEFWDPGVWYSSTPNYRHGRLVKCALGPLIVDLKAARQVTGCASHSANQFCMFCSVVKDDINNINHHTWEEVPLKVHKSRALAWKSAPTEKAQAKLFEKYGVRWSALLDLPYWDLKAFTIVDTMHTALLGNFHRHCTKIWRMDHRWADGLGEEFFHPPNAASAPPSEEVMLRAMQDLQYAPASKLSTLPIKVLKRLCEEKNILPPVGRDQNNRTVLLGRLKEYVSAKLLFSGDGAALTQHSVSIATGLRMPIRNNRLQNGPQAGLRRTSHSLSCRSWTRGSVKQLRWKYGALFYGETGRISFSRFW